MLLFLASTARSFRPSTIRQSVTRHLATVEKETTTTQISMDQIVNVCKRRGIIFPSSEIYNGYAGFWDFGPVGVELKRNLKDAWWKAFVTQRDDVVGLDSSIIHNPTTWKSSGM